MPYKISVHNKYPDGSILKLAFDTNAVLLHEALIDKDIEVYAHRMNNALNPYMMPLFERITIKSTI
jgi:hypothetical protein